MKQIKKPGITQDMFNYIIKVLCSCETRKQADIAYDWAWKMLDVYEYHTNKLWHLRGTLLTHFSNVIDKIDRLEYESKGKV